MPSIDVPEDDCGDDQRRIVGYIGTVQMDHWPEAERAILHSREGNRLCLRGADPCDPESGRVPVYEGDEVVVMEHISHVSLHTTKEGTEGYLLHKRVIPIREEPGSVIARALRFGEQDDGRRAHVRPGDSLVMEELSIELDYIDEWEGKDVEGYVPLTPVLFTWMSFSDTLSGDFRRYMLAAARRLDQAQNLFERIEVLREENPVGAPAVRRAVFELVGATELAVVSLGRAVDMCVQARDALGAIVEIPSAISTRQRAVREIRNAYEHIEDRALGKVRNSPHPDALTIFDHERVAGEGVIAYGRWELDMATDVPAIIDATRQFLKDVAKASPLAETPRVQPQARS